MKEQGRNDPCLCGSGKKYKQCCLLRREAQAGGAHSEGASQALGASRAIQAALEHFQAGRLKESESLCQGVLQEVPTHSDALHLLGLVTQQAGNSEMAIALIDRAIRNNPANHVFHNNLGTIYLAMNRRDEAVACFQKVISLKRDYAPAHYNLGAALQGQGKLDEAVACFQKVISLKRDYAPAHYSLGAALHDQGKLDEAVAAYHRALALRPDYVEAYNNLGNTLKKRGDLDAAVAFYQRALSLKADYVEAHYNLGSTLSDQGKLDEAVACYQRALVFDPNNVEALSALGGTLMVLGRLQESIQAYRRADEIRPSGNFKHMLAALEGVQTERAPDEYVESLFDNYADRFDSHLVQKLGYQIPALLKQTLLQHYKPVDTGWDILDLGCGTGLFGAEMRQLARTLVGVDLSEKMLGKARARNLYHRLVQSELSSMMAGESAETYDLVAATDVFIYIGKLDGVVAQAQRLLREGGYFIFSIELLDTLGNGGERDYALHQRGRYAHAGNYLARLRDASGFQLVAQDDAVLRLESGKPVNGWLVVWRKNAGV